MIASSWRVALALVFMAGVARAEIEGSYRLEGDEDGKPIVVSLEVHGDRVKETIGDRHWEGTVTRDAGARRVRFEVGGPSITPGVTGALDDRHGGGAGDRNVFVGTLAEDADGVVDEQLDNQTRHAPEEWAHIHARGPKKSGRLKLGGTLVATDAKVPVFVPTDGTLTITSTRGPIALRSPGGAVMGSGLTVSVEAKELGAWCVEVSESSRGTTLAARFTQKGAAKERPWSSHTYYPLYEFREDGAANPDTLYVKGGPLDKYDQVFGLTGTRSAVFWEKGGDYRADVGFEHGHYTRVASPSEASAELDWKCDLDGDGKIAASPEETFALLDADKDGVVTPDEAYYVLYEAASDRLFKTYDTDGDGTITEGEIGSYYVERWGKDGKIDKAAFRAGVERDHPVLLRGEAQSRRDALLAGRKELRPADLAAGYDFLDATDVDEDHRDLFDRDNVLVRLLDGRELFGNRVSADGALSLWKGDKKDKVVLDKAALASVKEVRRGIADGRLDGSYDAGWWGHCNAWGTAAILFPKPSKPVTVNGVELSVRDQKGLLVELCMGGTEESTFTWQDQGPEIDPRRYTASFHEQLAHWLRTEQKGLLADMELKDPVLGPWPVWNYPLIGYSADLSEAPGDDPDVLDVALTVEEASYSDDDASYEKALSYRLHFGARGEVRDDAASKTDWTTHIMINGEQKRGYVRYLIHPFRVTDRGSSGNPAVTLERVGQIVPGVNGGDR